MEKEVAMAKKVDAIYEGKFIYVVFPEGTEDKVLKQGVIPELVLPMETLIEVVKLDVEEPGSRERLETFAHLLFDHVKQLEKVLFLMQPICAKVWERLDRGHACDVFEEKLEREQKESSEKNHNQV